MTIFLCGNSLDGILTAVYDAWDSRLGHGNVRLEIRDNAELKLFCDYIDVETDPVKSKKVLRTIRRDLGEEAYLCICRAAASFDLRKADAIYKTIVYGLHLSKSRNIMNCMTLDCVCTVRELSGKCWNEAHRMMGFLRFCEIGGGILYAEIHPENDILPFIAPHFADRFPEENWLIYDENRDCFAVHRAKQGWVLLEGVSLNEEAKQSLSGQEDEYRQLWKTFVRHIAIEERKNEKLQKNLLPLKFRDKMTEWQ
ncbi:MAG: TIGR03915 family putative DNA repair protein [Lachnospiraceae bacterium]